MRHALPPGKEETMRRVLLGGLLAATTFIPAVSFASPVRDTLGADRATVGSQSYIRGPSLGAGMMYGTDPGHVLQQGRTPADTDTRGIINDVQVGRGTNDTPQNKNPPPAR